MAINMMCMNSDCEYYYEDNCTRNINEERIEIDSNGKCITYKKGISNWYLNSKNCDKNYKVKCINDNVIVNGLKCFTKGMIYPIYNICFSEDQPGEKDLDIIDDNGNEHGIATDKEKIWDRDKWFNKHFEIVSGRNV